MDVKHIESLLATGHVEDALNEARKGLPIAAGDVPALILWGVVNQLAGEFDEPESAYRQAERQCLAWMSTIWTNLAACYSGMKEYGRAAELIAELHRYKPFDAGLMRQVAWLNIEGKQYDKAATVAREYLKLVPRSPDATRTLFVALMASNALVEALTLTADIPLHSFLTEGHASDVSFALCRIGAHRAARQWLDETLAGKEEFRIEYASAMGIACRSNGNVREALPLLREAVASGGATEGVVAELCHTELALGEYGAGLAKLGARRAFGTHALPAPEGVPEWKGEPVAGKTILILSEQGFGDVIQFLRFVPELESRGARPVLLTYPDIVSLLGADDRAKACTQSDIGVLHFDFYVELMDLAVGFGIQTVQDIPLGIPYLFPARERVESWQHRLAQVSGAKIGLVWAGNPGHQEDLRRSASLADFSSLGCVPGTTFILLQKGPQHIEADFSPPELNCLNLCCEIRDFADTAAIISLLDLVVAVDTSVVHLAGALGKPVWMLNPSGYRDWRWGQTEAVAPWYPSVRIFEQDERHAGDWGALILQTIRPALLEWLHSQRPMLADSLLWHAVAPVATDCDLDSYWAVSMTSLRDAAAVACFRFKEFKDPRLLRRFADISGEIDDFCVVRARALAEFEAGRNESGIDMLSRFLDRSPTVEVPCSSDTASWSACYELLIAELVKQERLDEAAQWCVKALERFERNGRLQYWRAFVAFRMKRPSREQIDLAECAVAYGRRSASAKYLLAHILSEIDERGEPENFSRRCQLLQECIRIQPRNLEAWRAIATTLRERGAAVLAARILMSLRGPDDSPSADLYLIDLLVLAGDVAAAKELMAGWQNKDIKGREDRLALALALRSIGEHLAACDVLAQLVSEFPDFREAHFHFGWHLLSMGVFRQGWQEYSKGMKVKPSLYPEWNGCALAGRSLLVWQDQGSGDLLQFVDVLRDIRDGDVTLVVSTPLVPFLKAQNFSFRIIDHATAEREHLRYDFQIAQMKSLQYLDVDLVSPRRVAPFFAVDTDRLPLWREATRADAGLKVGIVWAGNPGYGNDYYRSSALGDWRSLARLDGVSLYSFQKDVASNQARFAADFDIKNIVIDCDGWLDTASALQLMDVVISVDSGVAHLASALGVKTWILLAHRVTDYRWMMEREDCPWYPTARLVRQQPGESWAEVLARVAAQLAQEFGLQEH